MRYGNKDIKIILLCLLGLFIVFSFITQSKILIIIFMMIFLSYVAFIFFNTEEKDFELPTYTLKISMLGFLILYSLSIVLIYFYSQRPLLYFILISILAVLLIFQIFSVNAYKNSKFIFLEILALGFNNIISQHIFYPLYNGYRDILFHYFVINKTVQHAHVFEGTQYFQFPFIHIFTALSNIITQISIQQVFVIILSLVFLLSLIFIYYIGTNLTKNKRFGLTCALLLACCQPFILWGTQMTPTSFSFSLMMIIVYILLNKKQSFAWSFILILFAISMVFSHNLGVIVTLIILVLMNIGDIMLKRINNDQFKIPFSNYLGFFVVLAISYWLYLSFTFFTSFFQSLIPILLGDLPTFSISSSAARSINLNYYISSGILIFLVLIFMYQIFNSETYKKFIKTEWLKILLCSSVFFIFILNIIFRIPIGKSLLIDRWELFGIPFIILIATNAVFLMKKRNKIGIFFISSLIFSFSFFSAISVAYDSSPLNNDTIGTPSSVFKESELYTGYFIKKNINDSLLTDFIYSSYLIYTLEINNVIYDIYSYNGNSSTFVLIRKLELENRGLNFAGTKNGMFNEILISKNEVHNYINYNQIYDDGSSEIYRK
ncbi:MAG: hypothetical protein QME14_03840 [Methanobacteriaceae archaeon]|nr:hypothetical protein [Methanobacteriaceae archaeon]